METKENVVIGYMDMDPFVTMETLKQYNAKRLHLIIDMKNRFEESAVDGESIFGESNIDVISYSTTNNYNDILRTLMEIINCEKDCSNVYVNIAGTPEFAAAAVTASMMSIGVRAFSVEYDTNANNSSITLLPEFEISKPTEYLVRGLRLFHQRMEENLCVNSTAMAEDLKKNGIWLRSKDLGRKPADAVHYHRDYIRKWISCGWVERGEDGKYTITGKGLDTIGTFYLD